MSAYPVRQVATRFTWNDYRAWPETERWELIDGVAYAMLPAPSTNHQRVTGRMFSRIEGAPTVVAEVLSPATSTRDQREKKPTTNAPVCANTCWSTRWSITPSVS